MSTTLQEEIELESREMNVWRCFECFAFEVELDSELPSPICTFCGNQNTRITKSFMYDAGIEQSALRNTLDK